MWVPTKPSSLLVAAAGVFLLPFCGATLLGEPIPRTILLTERDGGTWLDHLEREVEDRLRYFKIDIEHVSEADYMPDGFIPYLRDHQVKYYLRAHLREDASGVLLRFELREAAPALAADPWIYSESLVSSPPGEVDYRKKVCREVQQFLDELLPRIRAYVTEPEREHLLADCIQPEVADDRLLRLGKALTVRYHEALRQTSLAERYSIFGISPMAFNARCREDDDLQEAGYPHLVYGFLRADGLIELTWQEGADWASEILTLQGADEEKKAQEIADKLTDLEPIP